MTTDLVGDILATVPSNVDPETRFGQNTASCCELSLGWDPPA